jgi:hypothetical protein
MMTSLILSSTVRPGQAATCGVRRLFRASGVIGMVAAAASLAAGAEGRIGMERQPDRVRVTLDGVEFTNYVHAGPGRAKPVLHPLRGPNGVPLTRSWPLGPLLAGEPKDHPHQESFWFAHGNVNGHDFWTGRGGARIEHVAIDSAADGVIEARCRWLAKDGTEVCRDRRTMRFAAEGDDRTIDHEITITAGATPVVFGDTKEGTMAVRVRPELTVAAEGGASGGTGHYLNAAGDRDKRVWGRPAAWVDLSGVVENRSLGLACFDHPANLRHPSTWHARGYGLFAANPFGLHDFTGAAAGTGRVEIAPGESLTLRHRWLLHAGDAAEARIADRYAAWIGSGAPGAAEQR